MVQAGLWLSVTMEIVLQHLKTDDRATAMTGKDGGGARILVFEDVEETRDGLESLLKADGFRVDPARYEAEAVERARREAPRLILVGIAGSEPAVIATAARIREHAGLGEDVPIVIFSDDTVAEGAEVHIGRNVHLTRPDNFDQLNAFIHKLVNG